MRLAERRMRRPVAREIRRAMIAMAEAVENPGREFSVVAEHRAEMGRILGAEYSRLFEVFGGRVIEMGPKAHAVRETKFADRFQEAARAWIANMVANKVTPIVNTTRKQAISIIRRATQEAWDAGLGQRPLASAIMAEVTRQGGDLARWRADVIARTETHTAAQAAGFEAGSSLGLTLRKQWVASFDERTRDTHAAANGQTVGHSEMFSVGGYEAMYPGDASLPAEEVINCRCVSVAVVED